MKDIGGIVKRNYMVFLVFLKDPLAATGARREPGSQFRKILWKEREDSGTAWPLHSSEKWQVYGV